MMNKQYKNSNKIGQDSDVMFNTIVEISPNIIAILQEEKFVFINTKGLAILNCPTQADILGTSVFNFIDPEFHTIIKEHFVNKIYNGSNNPLHLKMLSTDQQLVYLELTSTPFTYLNNLAVLIIGRDVTLEVLQEEKLRETQKRYEEIFNNSHENMFLLEVLGNGNFKMLELNPQFEKHIGINRENLIGKSFNDFSSPSVADKVNEKCQQCVDTKTEFFEEITLELPSGLRYYNTRLVPILDSKGNVCRINGIAWDITKRKQLDALLIKKQRMLEESQEIGKIGSWERDFGSNIIERSDEIYKIYKMDPQLGIAAPEHFLSLIHPEDKDRLLNTFDASLLNNTPFKIEYRLLFPDGEIKHIYEICETFYDEQGNPIRSVGTIQDKTEYDNTKKQLEMLGFALNNASDAVFISEESSVNFIYVNDSACRLLDYSRDELLKLNTFDINPDVKMDLVTDISLILKTERSVTFETRNVTKDGLVFPVEITCFRYMYMEKMFIVTSTKDISERKQAEKALQDEHNLFNGGPNVAFKWKAVEGWPVEHVSMNVLVQFGYSPEDFIKGEVSYFDIIHPDDVERVSSEVAFYCKKKQGFFEQEYRIKNAYGDYRWIFDFTVVVFDANGEITHFKGCINDITERKLTEERLKETELRYSELFDNSNDIISLLEVADNNQFRVLAINALYESELKVKSSDFVGNTIVENYGEELGAILNSRYQRCIDLGHIIEETIEINLPTGKRLHQSTKIPIRNNTGKIYRLMVINHDITNEMSAMQDLEKNRELLSSVEINAKVGHFYLDYENEKFICSKGVYNLLGMPYDETVLDNLNVFEFIHPEDVPLVKERLDEAMKTNSKFNDTHRIVQADGTIRFLHCSGQFLMEPSGNESYFCNMQDVSDLYTLKEKVLISEDKIKILVENSPIGILILSERKPLFINNALLKFAGVDSLEALLKLNTSELVHQDDQETWMKISKILSEENNTQSNYQFTIRSPLKNGRSRVTDVRVTTCMMEGKNYVQILIIDITNEIEKENLMANIASDSLYINQKSSVVPKVKAELDTVMQHKCEKCQNDVSFKNILRILDSYSNADADWGLFNKNFNNLHPKFIENLKNVSPTLTLTDVKHCACIRLHIDTKETARFFNVSPTSIQTARVRLKKKLNIPKDLDLRNFICNL